VLVLIADRIEDNVVVSASGRRFPVEGPVGVFGPGQGRVQHGPFVMAALVALPDRRALPALREAYAHPCWSATDDLALDCTHEHRSLDILVRFVGWMAGQGYRVELTKPLYDRSRHYLGREEGDVVVKPDFEGKVFAGDGRFVQMLVAETMGFDHAGYRASKLRLRDAVRNKPTRYLEHRAHDRRTQEADDRQFRRDLHEFGSAIITEEKDRVSGTPPAPVSAPPASPPARPQPDPPHRAPVLFPASCRHRQSPLLRSGLCTAPRQRLSQRPSPP